MRDTRTHGRFYSKVGVMCDRYRRDAPPAYFVWKSAEVQSPQSAERPEVHATTSSKHTTPGRRSYGCLRISIGKQHKHRHTHTHTHSHSHPHNSDTSLLSSHRKLEQTRCRWGRGVEDERKGGGERKGGEEDRKGGEAGRGGVGVREGGRENEGKGKACGLPTDVFSKTKA